VPAPGQGDYGRQKIQGQAEYKSGDAKYTAKEKTEWVQRATPPISLSAYSLLNSATFYKPGYLEIRKMLWTGSRLTAIIDAIRMICGHCQAENVEGTLACANCGAALTLQPSLTGSAVSRPETKQKHCRKCGAANPADSSFCEACGADLSAAKKAASTGSRAQPARAVGSTSGAWWLLPIFFGWLGGLIAWLAVKDKDPGKARSMLIVGIVLAVLSMILTIILVMVGAFNFADLNY
jgi:ribosomal protein L40E